MEKVERCASVNRTLHKILLLILKVIPMLTALGYLLNTLFSYIGIDTPIFSHLVGMSLLPWIYILVSAVVFKFCIYHRMFLYYVFIVDNLNIVDYYKGIPVSDINLLIVHSIITGVFLFLILYFYVNHCKKPSQKDP